MKMDLKLPVVALVDSDLYGLKILPVYGCGLKNMSYDSANLTTPDIKRLGIRPSDLDKYKIPDQCRLPTTEKDIKTGKDMLEEDFVKKNPGWVKELNLMVKTKQKASLFWFPVFIRSLLAHETAAAGLALIIRLLSSCSITETKKCTKQVSSF